MDEPTTKGVDKYILEMELAENTKAKIDRINVKSIQNAEKKPNEITDWKLIIQRICLILKI